MLPRVPAQTSFHLTRHFLHTSPIIKSNPTNNSSILTRVLPTWALPYAYLARMDKPVGTHLLLIPCTWSILMSHHFSAISPALESIPTEQTLKNLALFSVGAYVMRGAGCTINDMWDTRLDRQVERTRMRPIASGQVSMRRAWMFLAAQLSVGLGILTQLNHLSIAVGAASMGLVSLYPLAKRVTDYPQFILGLTFNWGALLGWTAQLDQFGPGGLSVSLPLYAGGVAWTLIYDTVYAHQDKRDDAKIGVRSTALKFAERTRSVSHVLNAVMMACLSVAGWNSGLGWAYFGSLAGAGMYTNNLIRRVDLDDPKSCNSAFVKSQRSGWLITLGIIMDIVLKQHI